MRSVWLVAAIVLAGCSDPVEDELPEEASFDDLDLEATASTGVIRGIVIDDAIVPVAGVRVKVIGTAKETLTDEQGRFGFASLEPGSYFLDASKLGMAPTQQSATVEAGVAKPPIVRILMQHAPGTEPYVFGHLYTGYIGCSWKVANFVGGCNYSNAFGEEDSTIFIPLERPPTYYQNELLWESTQALGDGMVTIQWACAEDTSCDANSNDHRTCNVRGPSPLVCRVFSEEGGGNSAYTGINGTRLGEDGRGLTVRGYAHCAVCATDVHGVGLMLEQTVDFFTNFFYNYEPPEGWLFIRDGQYDPPQ